MRKRRYALPVPHCVTTEGTDIASASATDFTRYFFRHHEYWNVRIGTDQRRHHGRIHDAKVLKTEYATARIDHGLAVAGTANAACTAHVMRRICTPQSEIVY